MFELDASGIGAWTNIWQWSGVRVCVCPTTLSIVQHCAREKPLFPFKISYIVNNVKATEIEFVLITFVLEYIQLLHKLHNWRADAKLI